MPKPLRVGLVGASPERGWAQISHVPAIHGVNGVELAGVTGSTQAKADAAADVFGAKRGFADVLSMAQHPDIDLITIAVRVPAHRELVEQALAHGKHVYCEWPLGRNVAEAEALAKAADEAGVHAAIGLQARLNPALARARALVSSGALGRVLSARIYSGTVAFGPEIGEADSYLEDAASGATLATIHGGHALDAAIAVLGPFVDIACLATIQHPHITVTDGGRSIQRQSSDHLLSIARLAAGGGALSIEVDGGRPADDIHFRFEVTGEGGGLALRGGAIRGFQSGRLALSLNGRDQVVDESEATGMPDAAANVASVYAALRDDIQNNTRVTPDFDHAVGLSRLVAAMTEAADTGRSSVQSGWPGR